MKYPASNLTLVLMTLLLIACNSATRPSAFGNPATPTRTVPVARTSVAKPRCIPTFGDELSPSYKPNAPVRSVIGQGHILTGVVRSSVDCAPIPGAKLELWSEDPGGGHPDEFRSTVFADSSGAYRFECNPTDHIHMLISASGYRTTASNAYHTEGNPQGIFDIVLEPDEP